MRVIFSYICVLFLISSCDYFPTVKKVEGDKGRRLAKVYEKVLYESDLGKQLPSGLSEVDSVIFAKSYIDSWAKDQLLLHQAEFNLTDKSIEFENLVKDYRSTLYINAYKEALVLNKLDTAITRVQIENYYSKNQNNFKLNEELVRLKFIHTDSGRNDRKELVKLFNSEKKEDINELFLRGLEFKSFNLNDSIWIKYNDMISKIEGLKNMKKNKILKKSNFIQKEDSLGLYLVTVKEVLKRNDIAPISYITPTIKQIILQKRKLELLRKIEVDLLNDAIKKQYFEEY